MITGTGNIQWLTPHRAFFDFFKRREVVFIPSTDGIAKLVRMDNCVWDGPSWLQASHALSLYNDYTKSSVVKYLFQDVLDVGKADRRLYLGELLYMVQVEMSNFDHLCKIYRAIMQNTEDDEEWENLRSVPIRYIWDTWEQSLTMAISIKFEMFELIYDPNSKTWNSSEDCVWTASPTDGKIGISKSYPSDLEEFLSIGFRYRRQQ